MLISLVTCRSYPEVTPSDALLGAELERRGHSVQPLLWNPGPENHDTNPRELGDIVVLRSNWDYHEQLPEFEAWIRSVDESDARLVNVLALIEWGLRKSYLIELAERGAPVPRTAVIHETASLEMPSWVRPGQPVVIKPQVGASGVGVELVMPSAVADALATMPRSEGLVIQEFVADVDDGEWALVFFGGDYSHAFQRVPAANEFRINNQYGGTVRPGVPDQALADLAREVLELMPVTPVYARVDLTVTADGPVVMEVEVNEPSLRLDLRPDAPERFADALLDRDAQP